MAKFTGEKIVELKNIVKIYDKEKVVDDVSLSIKKGDFVTILGPSGCGKTTLLRMIAGFEKPTEGEIYLEGVNVTNIPPYKRNINTVFQKYALFPHLNVFNNIAYGLKLKTVADENTKKGYRLLSQQEITDKVNRALKMVDLEDYGHRDIDSLSGGQQQRIAIARAIVNEPKVLLLDEPLSALDLKMRKEMQIELRRLHKELGITFIYVTHDQEEAMTMSDTIVVMRDGEIQQVGTPKKIYDEPQNAYTADFIGESNIISAKMVRDNLVEFFGYQFKCLDKGFKLNEPVDVVVRPEDVQINPTKPQFEGVVMNVVFKGTFYDLTVVLDDYELSVKDTKAYPVGEKIKMAIEPDGIHVMPKEALTNEYKTVATSENTILIGDTEFEFVPAKGQTIEKGDQVVATINFDKIELTDDEEEGQISGNITDMIYKGKYYQVKIWLDNDTALIVDTPYDWDTDDRVGLVIKKEDIKVRHDEKD
ncbi:MAG: ABC transporter ATP-binding protein [Clostridia bacterium]|nr:ABC transporter ATP-binding protein [Clostridia bacterium]